MSYFIQPMKYILQKCLLFCACTILLSCVKEPKTDDTFKKEMFTHYADALILPSYNSYDTALQNLKIATTQFNTTPTISTLTNLQQAFLTAYSKWQNCEIYDRTSPADALMTMDIVNYYPTRKDSVLAYINRNDNSTTFIKSRNKNDKGLPAIEYLLFRTSSQQEIVDSFSIHPNAASYKTYLTSLVDLLIETNHTILSDWNTSYRNIFINSLSTDAASSFSTLVNSIAQRTDDFKRKQVGIPAGYSGNVPTVFTNPPAAQAYYSNNSIEYMLLTLNNMKDVLNGKGNDTITGKGLIDYIRTLDVQSTFGGNLADDILAQIDVCINKVNACAPDYTNTINNNKQKADDLFLEAKKLLVLMKVDVPSALGVSITYTDSDGD